MFVKGVRKHISTFCLPEKEKKTEKNNKRSWQNLLFPSTCHKNDLLNFICAFLVWSGPDLNLHKWVLNFSEFKFIRFYAYLIISVCYKYANFSVAICLERFLWSLSVTRKLLRWHTSCVLVSRATNARVFMERMKFFFSVPEVWISQGQGFTRNLG